MLAFSQLKGGKNDAAASLFGVFRNVGSAIGISVANTIVIRKAQEHRGYLTANLVPSSSALHETVQQLTSRLHAEGGLSMADAQQAAAAYVNRSLGEQANVLAYMDCFHLLMYVAIALLPLVYFFVVKKKATTEKEVADALIEEALID